MVIREANLEDSAAIAKIQIDSYHISYNNILPDAYLSHFTYQEQKQDWQNLLSESQGRALYIAESNLGEVIGYALGEPNSHEIEPFESELVAIHIRQDYQMHGIGQRLFAAVCRALYTQGCNSLFLWVLVGNPACSFYEKLGGKRIAKKPWQNNKFFGTNIYEIAFGWEDIQIIKEQD